MQPEKRQKMKSFKQRLALKSSLARETLSEFLGTLIMIVLGCGCVAQATLSRGHLGGTVTMNVGFAMAVSMAIYVTGGVSGGHINPAVSLAMCLFGRMKWFKLPFYVGAQFLGGFVGAAVLFGIYYDGLMSFAGGKLLIVGENATAHIFATYPASYLSLANAFADQKADEMMKSFISKISGLMVILILLLGSSGTGVLATMFLLMIVFAIFDSRNLGVPRGLEPIAVGLLVIVLSSSLGLNSGCAMNPARDLSPRLFTALAGWGFEVFTVGNNFWWVPVVGPLVGAVIGGLIYVFIIEIHHPDPDPDLEMEQSEDKPEKHELSVIM